jgi:hypothetical protein
VLAADPMSVESWKIHQIVVEQTYLDLKQAYADGFERGWGRRRCARTASARRSSGAGLVTGCTLQHAVVSFLL